MEKFNFDSDTIWMLEFIENEGRNVEDALTLVKYMEDQEVQELYEACVDMLPADYPQDLMLQEKKQVIVDCLVNGWNPVL